MTLVLLTGATRGIGQAAAIEIASQGVEVALVGRDADRVKAVAQEAIAAGGGAPVHRHVADLTLMAEVRALAEEVRGRYEQIDVLANNAGALFDSRKETSEGFERTFALNHLAPFLLTNLLRDRLSGGRVVTTASDAHKSGRLDLDDLQSEKRLLRHARVRHLEALQHPVHARAGQARAGAARQLLSPRRRAHRLRQERERDLEGAHHARRAVLPLAAARRPLAGVARAVRARPAALTGEYVQDEKVMAPSAQAQDDTLAEGLWERSAAARGPARRCAELTPPTRRADSTEKTASQPMRPTSTDGRGRS